MNDHEDLVWTSKQTAAAIKRSEATLARWRQRGIGPAFVRSVPGEPRSAAIYRPPTVRKWLEQNEGRK